MLHSIVALYQFQFIQNALSDGVFIAVARPIVGYFLIGGGTRSPGMLFPTSVLRGRPGLCFSG